MLRSLLVVALVLSLMWQVVAGAWPGGLANTLDGGEHTAVHLANEAHHHHDDGSVHHDDSAESASHMALDQSSSAVLLGGASSDTPTSMASPCAQHVARQGPHPYLDGPLRPPRLTT